MFEFLTKLFSKSSNNESEIKQEPVDIDNADIEDLIDVSWAGYYTK